MALIGTAIAGAATAAYTSAALLGAGFITTTAGVVTLSTAGATLAALAGAVVSVVVGGVLIDQPSATGFNATAGVALTNQKSNNAPIPLIYGTRRVGGIIVFMDTNVTWFFVNLVVSEGEIEGYEKYYFNNEIASDKHNPMVIEEFYGSETQEANASLFHALEHYTNSHKLSGTAYITFSLTYEPFPAGMPLINVIVKGIKTFDPRTLTTQWSNNPALCIRDYLTNARYGRGIDPSLIDDSSFISAANYCDELVTYNGIDFIKRYTCNGVAETQNSSLNIINKLLSSCRGLLIFSAGMYKLIIDKPELAVFTFSEDNIIGEWKIKLGSKNSQYNRMRANFFNAERDYQPDIAYVDSEQLRTQDGVLLERMIDLPFTTDITRAKAIITINLNQSRHAITCEFTSTIEGLRVEVGDVVYIKHKTPGWDTHNFNLGKKFRIKRVTLQNNDEVRIMASEYADEVYDVDLSSPGDTPTKIDLDDQSICLPPTDLKATQIVARNVSPYDTRRFHTAVEMSWTASEDKFISQYEIGYKYSTEDNWAQVNVGNTLNWSFEFGDGRLLYFSLRVRAINTVGVVSEWLE